jgi:hypothetical protein
MLSPYGHNVRENLIRVDLDVADLGFAPLGFSSDVTVVRMPLRMVYRKLRCTLNALVTKSIIGLGLPSESTK